MFRAYTDPKLIAQWWGPKRFTTTIDKMEVKPGGLWRFIHRDTQGHEYAFHGVYHDSVPPERLVYTFEFEGAAGHVSLETGMFEEHDGKTTFRGKSVFQSVEDRDAMIKSGMEQGLNETMERLTELLAGMNKGNSND